LKTIITEINSKYYKEAVSIRTEVFFKNLNNSLELINDKDELNGYHFVVLKDKKVIGTGRLNLNSNVAIISQMAVHPKNQKQGVGSIILNEMLIFLKTKNIRQINLCARLTALKFYSQKGFKKFGREFPSKKTGIMHQNMSLQIKNVC
tara:strand:+ start:65 stop:508 length:444 start_codon:yes stop_codon:yes gene_type:complete